MKDTETMYTYIKYTEIDYLYIIYNIHAHIQIDISLTKVYIPN